jgi:hypothetical protein
MNFVILITLALVCECRGEWADHLSIRDVVPVAATTVASVGTTPLITVAPSLPTNKIVDLGAKQREDVPETNQQSKFWF